MKDNQVGHWGWDSHDLPVFAYTGDVPFKALDRAGRDSQLPEDPCFLLGNYRGTLFAHASGMCQFITGERGWARLNFAGKNLGWNQSVVRIEGDGVSSVYELVGNRETIDGRVTSQLTGGVGYASWRYELPERLAMTKSVSMMPSRSLHEGNPSYLVRVSLRNEGNAPLRVQFQEDMLARYTMMNDQGTAAGDVEQRVAYRNRFDVQSERLTVKAAFEFEPAQFLIMPDSDSASFTHDIAPPTLFLTAEPPVNGTAAVTTRTGELGDVLSASFDTLLQPGEQTTLQLVIGLTFGGDDEAIHGQVMEMLTKASPGTSESAYAQLWREAVPTLEDEEDGVLRREMIWNAYTLEAMATYSAYFGETYVPQGSVYAYHLGQNASNRDHLQHMMPLSYTNPGLAKSCIRYAMMHTSPDGEIKRQNVGFGYSDPGVYMESDPQLYMFMAVGSYLSVTGDDAFLDEEIAYYPVEYGGRDTVLTFLMKHFIYLRDVVGRGSHGLVKMLNSDWSDSFFHPYSPNIYSLFAESHMNTAMALAVLPPLEEQLERFAGNNGREDVQPFLSSMRVYYNELFAAFMTDMEGRTFAPRCYIGEHDEPELKFGLNELCLEPQPFVLQIPGFPAERKRQLLDEIKKRVLDMEKSGARTREVPLWSSGAGEDGGIWFSHQGQLIAGMAEVDRDEAIRLLRKLTFERYAENYPSYWVGHWTFADSLDSTLVDREGLYHFWTAGAFQPFCAHVHAWQLYGYYKVYLEKNK